MIIETECGFEAAHRLMRYKGKCWNLHGHNWKAKIQVYGNPDEHTGMIVDFANLKALVVERFDHKVILNEEDVELKQALEELNMKVVTIKGEPTCERLAEEIAEMVLRTFPTVRIVTVWLWENEKSYASVTKVREITIATWPSITVNMTSDGWNEAWTGDQFVGRRNL